jgi:hypothetical protein
MREAASFEVVAGERCAPWRRGRPAEAAGRGGLDLSPALVRALSPAVIGKLRWPASVVESGSVGPVALHLAIAPAGGGGLAAAVYLLCAERSAGGWARVAIAVDGSDAFDAALRLLEAARREGRLFAATTPWPDVNAELRVACRLLDGVAGQWTPAQAAALCAWLEGRTQDATAGGEGVTQSAIAQRLRRAAAPAVGELLERYWRLVGAVPPAG